MHQQPIQSATIEQVSVEYRNLDPLGFPGYRVGDDGSVWTKFKRGSRPLRMTENWWPLKLQRLKSGYVHVGLAGGNTKTIHRLVLEAFVGQCPSGMECRHLDGNPANNRLSNLCWATHQENETDKVRHGTLVVGAKHVNSRLTSDLVRQARTEYLKGGVSYATIALRLGVSERAVRAAVVRETWRHVD